jgi:hypothetical protein
LKNQNRRAQDCPGPVRASHIDEIRAIGLFYRLEFLPELRARIFFGLLRPPHHAAGSASSTAAATTELNRELGLVLAWDGTLAHDARMPSQIQAE